jgi:hypothetical protein
MGNVTNHHILDQLLWCDMAVQLVTDCVPQCCSYAVRASRNLFGESMLISTSDLLRASNASQLFADATIEHCFSSDQNTGRLRPINL